MIFVFILVFYYCILEGDCFLGKGMSSVCLCGIDLECICV